MIKKNFYHDIQIFKDSYQKEDNFDISFDEEKQNYSENSLFENIEENNINNKKITFLKHKFCMLQKNLLNFMDNLEQFIMDNVFLSNSDK